MHFGQKFPRVPLPKTTPIGKQEVSVYTKWVNQNVEEINSMYQELLKLNPDFIMNCGGVEHFAIDTFRNAKDLIDPNLN